MTLHNDKIHSPSRIHSNHWHTYWTTEPQNTKEKADRIKGCNNYKIIVGDFNNQLSIIISEQPDMTENHQRNQQLEQHYESN